MVSHGQLRPLPDLAVTQGLILLQETRQGDVWQQDEVPGGGSQQQEVGWCEGAPLAFPGDSGKVLSVRGCDRCPDRRHILRERQQATVKHREAPQGHGGQEQGSGPHRPEQQA